MKKLLCLVIVSFIVSGGYCQLYRNASNFNSGVDSTAEALVALAMNNPQIRSMEHSTQSLAMEYSRSKTLWLNNITLAGNLNEYSIKEFSNSDQFKGQTLYPRYNLGVLIPLGIFVNSPKQAKADYYRYQAQADQVEVEKLAIRRNVIQNYTEYQMNLKLVALQEEVVQDATQLFNRYFAKFNRGEVTLETFTVASRSKNTENVRLLNVERDLKNSKTQLEALIGMNLDDALTMIRTRQESQGK
ncbi:MAG TPA: TolC family protein [Puia sp.]|nr:TolC family protein [Puia sp.]